jgi:Transcriptional regulatory protein, C terminal
VLPKRIGRLRYLFEDYALDTDRRELYRATDVIVVTPQVFDLLDYLIRNRERVVSKDDLINSVWNGRIVSDAALDPPERCPRCHRRNAAATLTSLTAGRFLRATGRR